MGSSTLALRDYQQEAMAAVHAAEQRGVRRPLVALPTGTGKTVFFGHLIHERGGRALVLAHRDELVRQAADKIQLIDPNAKVGIVKADEDNHAAQVVVSSVQTLSRANRLARVAADFETIVVDEAHHATADSYHRVLDALGAFDDHGPLTLGVTATPERADGTPLGETFDEIVYRRTMLEMIAAGYLSDLRAKQVRLAADFGRLHTRAGDFIESELEEMMTIADAPKLVARAYVEHAAGRKALLFTPTVALAHEMARALRQRRVAAEALDGNTPLDERRALLERFRDGDVMVIANCAVLTEGYDEPTVDCVIVARPTRSKPLYIQMVGRGTRIYPGKGDCLILDLVGATTRHDLMTAASLFGVRADDLDDATVLEAVAEQARRKQAREGQTLNLDGRLTAADVDLFRRRTFAWVQVSPVRWALSTGSGHLALDRRGDGWHVSEWNHQSRQLTHITVTPDLAWAQGIAEDRVRALGVAILADPTAPWRRKPASEKQLDLLRRLGVPVLPGMTAGRASELIAARMAAGRRR